MTKQILFKAREPGFRIGQGFFSIYTTILSSFISHSLGYSPEDIFIDEEVFYYYGNIKNWFVLNSVKNNATIPSFIIDESCGYYHRPITKQMLEELHVYASDPYIKFNQRMLNKFKKLDKSLGDNALGIHYRGTDHVEPKRLPIKTYLDRIDMEMNTHQYDTVFVCSDEKKSIEEILEHLNKYPNVKIIHNNCYRSDSNTENNYCHSVNPIYDSLEAILRGDEVVLDAHCLSQCKTIICKLSNLILFARITNPNINTIYMA